MAFVPAASTVRATPIFQTAGGNEAANVFHFRKGAGGVISAGDLATVADFLAGVYLGSYGNTASTAWALQRIELRAMDVADGPVLTYTDDMPVPGTRTSPALPDNVAACVTLYTGLAGRSRRGRVYHGGLTEDAVANNTMIQNYADNLDTLYDTIITAATFNVWDWVVASFTSDGAPRVTALLTPIFSATVRDLRVDTMRKRLD